MQFEVMIIVSYRVDVTESMHFTKKLISLIMNYPINAAILDTFCTKKVVTFYNSLHIYMYVICCLLADAEMINGTTLT